MRAKALLGLLLVGLLTAIPAAGHDDDGDHDGRRGPDREGDDDARVTCVMSHDPACGPLTWSPPPAPNDPATARFTSAPSRITTGDSATFAVHVEDPDAGPVVVVTREDYVGDDSSVIVCDPRLDQFGTWPPPPEQRHSSDHTFSHRYTKAGTYHVRFDFDVGCADADGNQNPYRSVATARVDLVVEDPPTCVVAVCLPR
jgi:hypothetical protein